jgi:choline dehydrogenase-like flavoprotein
MTEASWTDLSQSEARDAKAEADICIIGAGAVGIYLATRLAELGLSVVLIEAGPLTGVKATNIGFEASFGQDPYPGATDGRFFGMGGSTTHWGGALVPHSYADLRDIDSSDDVWSGIVSVVEDKSSAVLRNLGYNAGPDFDSYPSQSLGSVTDEICRKKICVQSGLYLPFRRKNMASLLGNKSISGALLRVFFNAVAKNWEVQEGTRGKSRIVRIKVVSRNGKTLDVRAGKFVICAGAIESARILLEIQDAYSKPVLYDTAIPGCYLGDHLSLPIADVAKKNLEQTAHLFAPRFSGAWMRGFRFVETALPPNAPRYFAHIIFNYSSCGFEVAKALLGALQQRCLPKVSIEDLIAGVGDLSRLGYRRLVQSRLYIPTNTPAHMQLDMEQVPARKNRVVLDNQTDIYGRRVVRIDWRISQRDIEAFVTCARRFLELWPGEKAGLPDLNPRQIACTDSHDAEKPYDAYHPVGTCRMGNDKEAVVDTRLKVLGTENLWLVSTGVLPSAGTANPTFTVLCLAEMLLDRLSIKGR